MKLKGILTTATLALGLALLAGCGEESVDEMNSMEAEPAPRVSDEAIGTDETQDNQNY